MCLHVSYTHIALLTPRNSIKTSGHLYFLHEFANFLNRGLFDFQQFGLLKKLFLHIYELTLQFLQSLPPLLTKPRSRGRMSDKEGSKEWRLKKVFYVIKRHKIWLQAYLAWLLSFFADWRAKTSSSFSFCSKSTANFRVCTFFCGKKWI